MNARYTGPSPEDLDRIPDALKAPPQWVLWRGADRIDQQTGEVKLNKIPINPQTLRNADTTDPATWGTFKQCVNALPVALEGWQEDDPGVYRGGGLGFVFAGDDPYAGIDLDHCRDPDTGQVADWAQQAIDALASYTEVTPSGTGLHILAQGALPPRGRRKGAVEMYDYARFFTLTGWHLAGTPTTIEARQNALTAFHSAIFDAPQATHQHGPAPQAARTPVLDDAALLTKARAAQNGTRFTALWAGDITGYDSPSNADLALCVRLAFWTQDAAQIDRLFRQSGVLRDKWDEKRGAQTYGERTIAEALARQTEHYRIVGEAQRRRNGQTHAGTDLPPAPDEDERPVIGITPEMTRVVDQGQAALLALPEAPVIFQRARRLCIIARGVPPPKWLHRPQDAPVIFEASPARLCELVAQAARWEKYDARKKGWVSALPPGWFVETLQGRPSWPFPVLEGVVYSPTLRPDGTLLDTPGYDPDTGLFLDTNGTTFPTIPLRPTLDDARTAIGRLQEAVMDFPFAEPWHFSATLAAVLSLVCRFTIMGNVPLFAIRAHTRGSGKSLLADVVSMIGTGRAAPRWPQVTEDEEERKRLLTVALAGYPVIHIDNVTRPLGSPALDLALTAPSFSDRILGKHDSREAPLSMVWLASGNNMQFQGDTARRILPIDLDPKMERPEERTGFQHNPLTPWVQQERPRLTVAALTILRAYFEADCPAQGVTPFGSFEQWSDLVRQALIWAGEADPCEGRKDIEAESDPEFEVLGTLLHAWKPCYPHTSVTLKQVLDDIHQYAQHVGPETTRNIWNDLQDALGSCDQKYDGESLRSAPIGYALRKWQGRIIDGMRLVKAGTYNRAAQWHIECLER